MVAATRQEIERKFLVVGEAWRDEATETQLIRQGYLALAEDRQVRVRLRDGAGSLTVKQGGAARERVEIEVPLAAEDAAHLLDTACVASTILKHRYLVPAGDRTVEIDVFEGDNVGLILAEVELDDPDGEVPDLPWLGPEVTGDARYYNANLARRPFTSW